MTSIKNQIQEYFENNNNYIKAEELKKILKIKGEEQTNRFYDDLNALIEEGSLFFDEKKGYKLFANELGVAYGEIEITKSGNGFVHTNEGYTIFIENKDLNGALDGDSVIISSIDFGRRDEYKGEVYRVIKRKTGNVFFEVVGNGYNATLIPCNINENIAVNINKNEFKNLVDGEILLVNVGVENVDGEYKATISEVVGHKDDADIDINLIYAKYGVPVAFSEEALKEAEELPTEVTEKDIKNRVDLRNKNIITIDCDGTKDRDDAIYVEKLENGNFKLYVSISSVNYYVKRGSKLFEEALTRNTSHYPNNTCNPLFPHKLSNGICSLNENVDRLTKTCEMEITPEGKVVNYDIYNSVINSKKAMKYSEVNRVLKGEMVEGYEDFEEQLKLLEKLSDALESAREKRNYINFDVPDIQVENDEFGKIKGFKPVGIGVSERIIENCMLITGTTVAEHYSWLPFIYRVHECPDELTVKNVIELLQTSGFRMPKINNIDEHAINNILNKIKTKEEAEIVRTILLKAMKRAKYDTNNIGHFALQLEKYCHFTSPIRRITDFIIHTVIDELEELDYSKESIERLENELHIVSQNATKTEKIAQKIENEALAMSMAEYMQAHIGEEYNAIITEVYQHGMFVKTDDHISGKVKFENIYGDYFYYNEEQNAIIGKNTKTKYQIGNKICVIAKDASKETRTINFEIGKQKSLGKKS